MAWTVAGEAQGKMNRIHRFRRTGIVSGRRRYLLIWLCVFIAAGLLASPAGAQIGLPKLSLSINDSEKPQDVAVVLQVLLLLTILSLAPAILMLTTCFTRVVVVLSFLRRALGTNQTPSNQIVIGLSLFLTFFIMAPTWKEVHQKAIVPYLNEEFVAIKRTEMVEGKEKSSEITPFQQAAEAALIPVRGFMFRQLGNVGEKNIITFLDMANMPTQLDTLEEIPTYVLIPAFVIAELHRAFIISFLLFLPFMIIDIVTSSILMSMGMIMLPPVLISLPFKLLLFVMIDGWSLLVSNLARGFL
jgi:flagellar biosynthesis protein FliP